MKKNLLDSAPTFRKTTSSVLAESQFSNLSARRANAPQQDVPVGLWRLQMLQEQFDAVLEKAKQGVYRREGCLVVIGPRYWSFVITEDGPQMVPTHQIPGFFLARQWHQITKEINNAQA